MKTYEVNENTKTQDLLDEMARDLSVELVSAQGDGRLGKGCVLSVSGSMSNFGPGFILAVEMEADHNVKRLLASKAYESGAFRLEEEKYAIVEAYQAQLLDLVTKIEEFAAVKAETEKKLKEEFEAAEAERVRAEKQAKKYEEYKANALKKLSALPSEKVKLGINFYGVLGWLASHSNSLSAALPDFAEPWFRSYFGDAPARVVDQSKRGPAGYTSQWGLSFTISLKKSAKDHIPMLLREYTESNDLKNISNVKFIFTLLTDYGFKIGKKQDVDEIRKYIPAEYITDFEEGYAAA